VLEEPEPYRVPGGYICEDVSLGDDVMGPALALIDRPNTVFEAKAVGQFAGHDVVAKADQVRGTRIIETKTTFSTFDFDKYAASCQWRFMLDLFNAAGITYHVHCLSESEQNGVIGLKSIESFSLYPYADMRQDCEALVRAFDQYVTAKGLLSVLEARQAAAVGAL